MYLRVRPTAFIVNTGLVTVDVSRYPQGTLERGRWYFGEPEIVQVRMNVQPLSRYTDTAKLAEGDRSKAALKVFALDPLQGLKEGDESIIADTFEWQGDLYQVQKVEPWKMGVMDHYETVALKKEAV